MKSMFEVESVYCLDYGNRYMVYDVRDTGCDCPDFLIFHEGWVYVKANYFRPVEKENNNEED